MLFNALPKRLKTSSLNMILSKRRMSKYLFSTVIVAIPIWYFVFRTRHYGSNELLRLMVVQRFANGTPWTNATAAVDNLLLERAYILNLYDREILRLHVLRERLCGYALNAFLIVDGEWVPCTLSFTCSVILGIWLQISNLTMKSLNQNILRAEFVCARSDTASK